MMNFIKEMMKGAIMGVANIIPGVSGGTMALSMGIYEKMIHAINHIKDEFKQSIKTLLPYVIGIVLGIICLSFIIEFSLNRFELPTLLFFIGLILGGLGPILKRVENEKFKITHLFSFLLFAGIIIVPTLLATEGGSEKMVQFGFASILIMLIMGIISAASMVVPGVSGSMILMLFGYYGTILSNITLFLKSAIAFDIGRVLVSCGVLVPFGIGVLLRNFLNRQDH